ncbi:hypothetical protein KG088_14500 [Halomonas sp. TRM85114]|uniref:hypothetical protein n=1 Tax=Halomonas jincaotanensis TaxID=2810616 RepID=UPI001BD2D908|nr:hypothetical protein [Halomonas jincaotanensis]MBS9404845.1 hypothetical protein [Halomonas jincaotanensis]
MIWHLIAAVFAGLGAAGVGLVLRLVSGKRLPRWIVPVCAGLGMLAYQINHEYSWFNHKQAQLPDSAKVVDVEKGQAFWRPWTYAFPMTIAFSVVDQDDLITGQADGQRLVQYRRYRFKKEYVDQVTHQAYLMNCTSRETVPLAGEPPRPRTEAMQTFTETDHLFQVVCQQK